MESVLLANGDEAQGVIENATPEVVNLNSEVGLIELPMPRLTMIDFGGQPPRPTPRARLRLVRGGALTVTSYQIEKETVICQTELAGELKLPLAAVQEVVFARVATPTIAEQLGLGTSPSITAP